MPLPASGRLDIDLLERRALALLPDFLPAAVELRRAIHQEPRVGGDEDDTRERIIAELGDDSVERAHGGFLLRVGAQHGPAIAIRSELDALPIQERSDVPWRSRRDGVAHLCGHDVHMAALSATARVVAAIGAPVPLLALYQPREEVIPSGAEDFVGDATLLRHDVRAMIGVHMQPAIPAGTVSVAPGVINAAADNFDIVVRGRPAHGAYPHLARDPIVAAAALVQALQHVVARRIDPMNPAVVTVGRISGGEAYNQIPGEVALKGTIRTYTEADRELAHALVRSAAESTAEVYGCVAEVTLSIGEPVLRNDEALVLRLQQELETIGLELRPPVRTCGADDFAYYSAIMPSLMVFLGTGDGDPRSPGLHHPRFVPDDSAIGDAARVMLLAYFAAARIQLSYGAGADD